MLPRGKAKAKVKGNAGVAASAGVPDFSGGDDLDELELADLESLKRAAHDACIVVVEGHLEQFLQQRTFGSYEEWVAELHPENVYHNGKQTFDHRFYNEDSDHLRLWNARVDWARNVPARSKENVAPEIFGEAEAALENLQKEGASIAEHVAGAEEGHGAADASSGFAVAASAGVGVGSLKAAVRLYGYSIAFAVDHQNFFQRGLPTFLFHLRVLAL
jgi:hypothetical protein